jgi:hypothetical protein
MELAVLKVKAERSVGIHGVSVFAGEGFELRSGGYSVLRWGGGQGWRNDLGPSKIRPTRQLSKTTNSQGNTKPNQAKNLLRQMQQTTKAMIFESPGILHRPENGAQLWALKRG